MTETGSEPALRRLWEYLHRELEASRKSDAELGWETARTEEFREFCQALAALHGQASDEGN